MPGLDEQPLALDDWIDLQDKQIIEQTGNQKDSPPQFVGFSF